MELATLAGQFLLGLVFLTAGLSKVRRMSAFRAAVANYQLLPKPLVSPVAQTVLLVEVAGSFLLLLGVAVRLVASVFAVMLLVFAAAAVLNLSRRRHIDCGCYGVVPSQELSWWHVSSNVSLAGLAVLVALRTPVVLEPFTSVGTGLGARDALAAPLVACILYLLMRLPVAAFQLNRQLRLAEEGVRG